MDLRAYDPHNNDCHSEYDEYTLRWVLLGLICVPYQRSTWAIIVGQDLTKTRGLVEGRLMGDVVIRVIFVVKVNGC